MRSIILSLILTISLFGDIVLVGNSSCKINTISNIELKNLYLSLNKLSNNEKINFYDRDDLKIYEEFVTNVLKKSVVSLETYWVRMLFSGKAKPHQKISFSQILDLKDSSECSISYVKENEFKTNFKRIMIVE